MIGLALFAAVMLLAHLASTALTLRRYRKPPPRRGMIGTPRLTLVRPVCGVEAFDTLTLGSSFRQDYPDYEVIFCVQRPDDPAIALVRGLIAANPGVPARLLIGEAGHLRNPKLRNIWKGWHAAQTDWICVTDSNLLLPRTYLSTVCAAWGPQTGLVSSPPVGTRPQGLAAHLECAFLNANQARLQLAADTLGMGFAQGKTLFFYRPILDRAGGLAALDRCLAEDVNATRLIRAMGRDVTLTPVPFAQPIGRRSLRQVWDRQVRWAQVRREGFPALSWVEPLNGGLLPVLATFAAAHLAGVPLVTGLSMALVWYGAEMALMRRAGWSAGWRDIACLPLRDLLIPLIWLEALTRRTVSWRGTRFGASTPTTAETA